MSQFEYAAFITYSHSDSRMASWLQGAIESYRLPANLIGQCETTSAGARRLGKVFLDREELSAGATLGETIRQALAASRHLIVICSPASARSKWVNLEIQEFKRTHPSNHILCLIADGVPFGSTPGGDSPDDCFPPALGYTSQEATASLDAPGPVAVDLRNGGDGRRLAKLKVISGLLDVRLDELVQRDAQRRNRRLLGLSIASSAGMVILAVLTIVAVDARVSEQHRRAEAEDLIEFMLTDLRNRLEAVGRLDVLDAVGEKSISYYAKTDLNDHTASSLGRRARALLLLGEVYDLRGDVPAARSVFYQAYETTKELVRRSPEDAQLIYDHAQSAFWIGFLGWRVGEYLQAENAFTEYLDLADRLLVLDSQNLDWVVESGHAHYNLGVLSLYTGDARTAIEQLHSALDAFAGAIARNPQNSEWPWSVAQTHAWLADAYEMIGHLDQAIAERLGEAAVYTRLLESDPGNQDLRLSIMNALIRRADLLMQHGDVIAASELLADAREIGAELSRLDPENTFCRHLTASAYAGLAQAVFFDGRPVAASELLGRAEAIAEDLIATDESVIEWQLLRHRIGLQNMQFRMMTSEGDKPETVERLQRIDAQLDSLALRSPRVVEVTFLQARTSFFLAMAFRRLQMGEVAEKTAQKAVNLLTPIQNRLPPSSLSILSLGNRMLSNHETAEDLDSRLEAMRFAHPEYVSLLRCGATWSAECRI